MSQVKKGKPLPKGDRLDDKDILTDSGMELRSRCETLHEVVSAKIIPLEKGLKAYDVTMEQYLGYLMMQDKKIKISMNADVISSMVGVVLAYVDTNPDRIDESARKLVGNIRHLSVMAKRKSRNRYYGKVMRDAVREMKTETSTETPTVASMIKKSAKRDGLKKGSKVLQYRKTEALKKKAKDGVRAHPYK